MTSPLLSRSLRRRALLQAGAACLALPAWPPAAAQDPEAADSAPRWIDADGQARPAARTALALLAAAGDDGLDPLDYDADRLAARLPAGASRPDDPAAFEAALTRAMRRLLDDLHHGRVDPRSIHSDFTPPPRGAFDAGARLDAALAAGDLARAVREAAPTLQPYRALRAALARWRRLAADPAAWRETLPPLPGRSLAPGGRWAGVPLLERRLRASGDLAGPRPAGSAPVLDATLTEALRAFQRRHGMTPDGVLGRTTLAQLQVPPAARVRQIELTMERLRWTPLRQAPRIVIVNLPEFVLRACEVDADGEIHVRHEMRVIVGQALDHRTPLFDEDMRSIEFSPYWNVPPSIARGELVPRLRRDPGFWSREGFEFVDGEGRAIEALSADRLDAVLEGRLRLRQRPGPRNALGDIKFVFPNRDAIYLHHTPSTGLFARDRRDLSHGCIRVEQPEVLAGFVLKNQPGWDETRIRAAMQAGSSKTIRLAEPVPVLLAYGTALVRDGRTAFFDDLYGLDRVLDAALRRRSDSLRRT
ncbi:L,D-transpeptidase family protein [Sphaerotilus uruguayifluvii]|uniref:Murein L,D-transpeptidase YcbB/YkuD n=1 Tax=Sphaerotilus uruguayifluvii TaxID=2735897 RepID=A0ABX2G055_9BURK|nr:L,D-transpeptidase family protein [Leptothrix sp. C29]NRT54697.1 murein L,D-transpeptidase YcbB/YkuD [Leptothrix sp. C29]